MLYKPIEIDRFLPWDCFIHWRSDMKRSGALGLALIFAFAPTARSQQNSSLKVSFPGKTWAIQIPASGFKVEPEEIKPDGRKYLLATNDKNGVTISVTLERGGQPAKAEECHESMSRRAQQAASEKVTDIGTRDVGLFSILEYTITQMNGIRFNQRNIFACLAKEDVYADLHLSKVSFQPSDEGLLMAYVQGAQLVDVSPGDAKNTGPTSMDYFWRAADLSRSKISRAQSGLTGMH